MTALVIDRILEDEERIIIHVSTFGLPFSRSNGTVLARIYERLTKQSRRRFLKTGRIYENRDGFTLAFEKAYRQGVYDAFKALQKELL